jgi:threonine dehydrogenase-like Zn-dependent dehydrogenase
MRASVFEAAGRPLAVIELADPSAPLFGRVVVVGACMETDHFQPMVALTKELTFRFVLGHTREDFAYVIDCLACRRIQPSALLTGVVGFGEFAGAFDSLRHAADGCKLLLRPN